MKRKILILMRTLLLVMGTTAVDAFAAMSGNELCLDSAGCITEEQRLSLDDKLKTISENQKCEVVIYVTDDFHGKTATEYADDYFDLNNYGYGDGKDGILLLINTDTRDWAISTHGYGITAFTDAGQEYIIDQIKPYLSEDDFASAFDEFADQCDIFLTQAATGEPYDSSNMPGSEKSFSLIIDILAGIVAGCVIAFIVVGRDKAALKSVRREAAARNYMRPGSLKLLVNENRFLYSHVDRIPKKPPEGSSTHTSSSGEIHGGSSGKF